MNQLQDLASRLSGAGKFTLKVLQGFGDGRHPTLEIDGFNYLGAPIDLRSECISTAVRNCKLQKIVCINHAENCADDKWESPSRGVVDDDWRPELIRHTTGLKLAGA